VRTHQAGLVEGEDKMTAHQEDAHHKAQERWRHAANKAKDVGGAIHHMHDMTLERW
jgi:hypothetical protein